KYRRLCAQEALAQGLRGMSAEAVRVRVILHRPNRRRDFQNCISCFKAGIDGIADVIGIDDRNWRVTFTEGEVRPPHGLVVVELAPIDTWESIGDAATRVVGSLPVPQRGAA